VSPTKTPPAPRRSLLIVDTAASPRDMLRRSLEACGLEVSVVSTGSGALERLANSTVTAAVLDDDLGAGSALSLIAALKAARPELEIAVVTARASVAEAVQALKLGATGYLASRSPPIRCWWRWAGRRLDCRRRAPAR
jgi:ActR/RegA family two-component response regulator